MRKDDQQFNARKLEIVILCQENVKIFAAYLRKEPLSFFGLPDPKTSVLKLYRQDVNLFKLGRMPAQVRIDKSGMARFVHYGHSMSNIPENPEILDLADDLNQGVTNNSDFFVPSPHS